MNKIVGSLVCALMSTSLYAKDIAYIGTKANPIPLVSSKSTKALESIKIYLYKDNTYDIFDKDIVLFSGTFIDQGVGIVFNNRVAFANKVYISENGVNITCLQTMFYQPANYAYQTDWFCPVP